MNGKKRQASGLKCILKAITSSEIQQRVGLIVLKYSFFHSLKHEKVQYLLLNLPLTSVVDNKLQQTIVMEKEKEDLKSLEKELSDFSLSDDFDVDTKTDIAKVLWLVSLSVCYLTVISCFSSRRCNQQLGF